MNKKIEERKEKQQNILSRKQKGNE